jgi:hypothetical protein
MDLDAFKKKLKSNEYDGATGARRALGRAHMNKAEKTQAAAAIDRKFGKRK